jgi:hypothetical protein
VLKLYLSSQHVSFLLEKDHLWRAETSPQHVSFYEKRIAYGVLKLYLSMSAF